MAQARIYCVDDDVDILALYRIILSQEGYAVTEISSGEKALEQIYQKDPDLIILDEKMSNLSGMEICTRIREDKTLPFIPIIMVTGVDSRERKIKSLEKGVDDYILKPFDHEELLAKVQVMLRIKRLYSDLLKTRQDLIKAERLAAVGQLAAGMAHEIRNPLSIIGASVQFIKNKMTVQDDSWEMMSTILRKISEIDGIIRELLIIARPIKLKSDIIDLNACLQNVLGFIREKCLAHHVKLHFKYEQDLARIIGDEEYLQRIFLNILLNALDSMPKGGELHIFTRQEDKDTVGIEIKDNGEGISPEDMEHLFEPFFSRKVNGSGLGLFMVKMIVGELKGDIKVNSTFRQGTTFTIFLPGAKDKINLKSGKATADIKNTW
ncbi:response regulator [bacterium]|nr:response regulator [bacterium]